MKKAIRGIVLALVWLGSLAAMGATLLGAAAPLIPYWELINHFRPFGVLGIVILVGLAWIAGSRLVRWFSAGVLAVNAALFLIPLVYASGTASSGSLRITTFNLWVGNRSVSDVVGFVAESGADIVVMQEVDGRLAGELVPALRAKYPYAVSCADRTPSEPPLLWARFATADGREFTVTDVHLAFPFQPEWQARQIESLIHRLDQAEGTQIIAGDFNLTPFSWKLNRLTAETGFRRHATFGFSWPANQSRLFPFVLLDNLLSTPDVRSAGISIGSSGYGSDHRPVTFDLAL
jgi:endonuclease/exonuclease/phosphatase (EEP) superfamily protein YafD